MKLLKRYFIFSFFMLLMLSFVIPALAQGEKKDDSRHTPLCRNTNTLRRFVVLMQITTYAPFFVSRVTISSTAPSARSRI